MRAERARRRAYLSAPNFAEGAGGQMRKGRGAALIRCAWQEAGRAGQG